MKFLVRKPAAIVDTGRVVDPEKAEKAGFVYRGIGRGRLNQNGPASLLQKGIN